MIPPILTDLHCHGALGANFGDNVTSSRAAAEYFDASGTRVIASLVSAPGDTLATQVGLLAPLVADGTLVGIHIEGPFLSTVRRGAQNPAYLGDPEPRLIERLVDICTQAGVPDALRHWTFAPELPGSRHFVECLARHGIRPAIGHTDADAAVVSSSLSHALEVAQAPPLVTHLFNGMPAFHHRAGGPAAAALAAAARGEAIVELIADGVHVAPEVLRLVFDFVGGDYIALVSDAMAATGLGEGQYDLGGLAVVVQHGTARLANDGSIAGSTRTLRDCLQWAVNVAGVDADEALCAATSTPAGLVRPGATHPEPQQHDITTRITSLT